MQKGFDTVSRQLLYEVDVTGTTAKPAAAVTPAPMLTRRIKWIMGAASDKSGNRTGLLDAMHKDQGVPTGTQSGNGEPK